MVSLNAKLSACLAIFVVCLSTSAHSKSILGNEFSSYVTLYLASPEGNAASAFCKGAIISSRTVLTTAACALNPLDLDESKFIEVHETIKTFEDLFEFSVPFIVGHIGATADTDLTIKFDRIEVHPSFDQETVSGNLAILRTVEEIPFSHGIQPITFYTEALEIDSTVFDIDSQPDEPVLGLTPLKPNSTDIASRETMKSYEVKTMSNEQCLRLDEIPSDLSEYDSEMQQLAVQLRSVDLSGKVSTEPAGTDEMSTHRKGSPLILNNQLVGLLSVALDRHCNMYSSVSHHQDWIKSEMENILA